MDEGIATEQEASGLKAAEPIPAWLYGVMVIAAIGGGWTAVAVAIVPGLQIDSAAWLFVFMLAPFYEEALKPLGVYFIFLRWPHIALTRTHIALLCATGGLTFALVESWLYVEAYPNEGSGFVLFRFTAPVAMHVASSFVFGLGVSPAIFAWPTRRAALPRLTCQAYFSAVGIHAAYNAAVLILAIAGVRDFVEHTGTE